MTSWILVADDESARLFEAGEGLEQLERITQYRARTPVPPRRVWVADRKGDPRPPEAWSTGAERPFAREIGDLLLQHVRDGAFDQLIVVAPERVLSLLREECDGRVAERVIGEVPRNLAWVPDGALLGRLRRHLSPLVPA